MLYLLTRAEDTACDWLTVPLPSSADALAAPQAVNLLPQALSLLPTGAAWGTPDGEEPPTGTVRAKFWEGLLGPFADLFAAGYDLSREFKAATLDASIADWEADYGLPDPCGGPDPATVFTAGAYVPLADEDGGLLVDEAGEIVGVESPEAQVLEARRIAIRAKVASRPVMTAGDYVCLASSLGFDVDVLEYRPFRCGEGECGEELGFGGCEWTVTFVYRHPDMPGGFEAGASECGGDDEVGEAVQICNDAACGDLACGDDLGTVGFPWTGFQHFECGVSECGDPLGEYPFPAAVRCRIEAVVPAEIRRVYAVPLGAFAA